MSTTVIRILCFTVMMVAFALIDFAVGSWLWTFLFHALCFFLGIALFGISALLIIYPTVIQEIFSDEKD